jgi:hypothetical protein
MAISIVLLHLEDHLQCRWWFIFSENENFKLRSRNLMSGWATELARVELFCKSGLTYEPEPSSLAAI